MSEYTFLVLGDSKIGKSALIRKFCHGEEIMLTPYSRTTSPTVYRVGDARHVVASAALFATILPIGQDIPESKAVNVIDTPGSHTLVEKWVKSLIKKIDCVVIPFAVDDRKSLANLQFWYRVFEDALGSSASCVRRILIATKCDGGKAMGDDTLKHIDSLKEDFCATFLSTSAYTGSKVQETFAISHPSKSSKIGAPKECSPHSRITTMPHTSVPAEVDSADFVINDIAFSSEGLTMKSNEILLKWSFLPQLK